MGGLTFFDVETTGLAHEDRIVSLGALFIADERDLIAGRARPETAHLVFNPGRPSHPRARKVHGYSDSVLRRQDTFEEHAEQVAHLFQHGGVAVAHNASFDRRFVGNELRLAGKAAPNVTFTCTMLMHRERHGPPSGLDAVLQQMAMEARTGTHGALSDAWYAMAIYCWLNGWPLPDLSTLSATSPSNLRTTPPQKLTPPAQPVAFPASMQAARSRNYVAALNLLRPLATFLVAIARADGEVLRAEVEVISLLMHTMLEGRQSRLDDAEHQDLLAELVALEPTTDNLDQAAMAVVRSPDLRQAAGGWIRQMTMADGDGSPAEITVINDIAARLRSARTALPPQIGS